MADARKRRLQILAKDLFSAFRDEAAQTPKGVRHDVYANVATVLEALHFALASEDRKALGEIAKTARATKKKHTTVTEIREDGAVIERFSTIPGMLKTSDAATKLVSILDDYVAVAKPYFALVAAEKAAAAALASDLREIEEKAAEVRVVLDSISSSAEDVKRSLAEWDDWFGDDAEDERQVELARQGEIRKTLVRARRNVKEIESLVRVRKAAYETNDAVRAIEARNAVIDAVMVHLNTSAYAYGPRLGSSEEAAARIGAELDASAKRAHADGERLAAAALVGWCGDLKTRERWRQIVRQRRRS